MSMLTLKFAHPLLAILSYMMHGAQSVFPRPVFPNWHVLYTHLTVVWWWFVSCWSGLRRPVHGSRTGHPTVHCRWLSAASKSSASIAADTNRRSSKTKASWRRHLTLYRQGWGWVDDRRTYPLLGDLFR